MNEFVSLEVALEGQFEKPLTDVPVAVLEHPGMRAPLDSQLDRRAFSLLHWDGLSPSARRQVAQQWDLLNDPAHQMEGQRAWDLFVKCGDLERKIAELEIAPAKIPSEIIAKDRRLAELRQEIANLKEDTADAVSPTQGGAVAETIYETGAPGRPTSMGLVHAEFERRRHANELATNVTAEAESLRTWLSLAHKRAPELTAKTIKNKISAQLPGCEGPILIAPGNSPDIIFDRKI